MPRKKPTPIRPGLKLLETLEKRHMSQAELCARIGRSRKLINEIIKGKASIAYDTALQLEIALGVPAMLQFMLRCAAGCWSQRRAISGVCVYH